MYNTMKRLLNIFVFLFLITSCTQRDEIIPKPEIDNKNIEQTKIPTKVHKNIILLTESKDSKKYIKELRNSVMLAFTENPNNNIKIIFSDTDTSDVNTVFLIKLTDGVVEIIQKNITEATNNISIKYGLLEELKQIKELITTKNISIICVDENKEAIKTINKSILGTIKGNDIFIENFSPNELTSDNKKYKCDILFLSDIFNFDKIRNIEYNKLILLNSYQLTFKKLTSIKNSYFYFKNLEFFKKYSDKYKVYFQEEPKFLSTLCYNIVSTILNNLDNANIEQIKSDLIISDDEICQLYYIDYNNNYIRD